MDVLAVEKAARNAAEAVRAGGGPHFLELRTYRFRAHSMYDPELYRDKDEVEIWKKRDPIDLFSGRLRDAGELSEADLAAMQEELVSDIDRSVEAAREAPAEPVEDLTRFVYSPETS
jgi:pyruvate dehydrogenase E1 component alpha subunit